VTRREKKKIVAELYKAGKTSYEIGKVLNLSGRTIERYEQELRNENKIGYRKDFLSLNKNKDKGFKREFYDTYTSMIGNLRDELSNVEPYKLIKTSSKKVGDTLVVQITDWHVGRIAKDEGGQIVYDFNIFKERIDRFATELLKLVDKYITKGVPIKEVVLISTGDLCDGSGIFASQETVSELSPPFQVVEVVRSIQKLITAFVNRKLKVRFYGVKGNHGEIRFHGKSKDPNANWDLMVYLMLDFWAKAIFKNSNLEINYSERDYLNFVIRGWNYHIRHAAPKQSETAAGKAKFLGWAKKHGFDSLAYGHLHHYGVWDRSKIIVFRGGALTADEDEFAESLAEDSEVIQLAWGVNENHNPTFVYPIDLGKKTKPTK
jgi:predicted phosphodiesterase